MLNTRAIMQKLNIRRIPLKHFNISLGKGLEHGGLE